VTGLFITLLRIALFLTLAAFVTSFITSNTAIVTLGFFPLPYAVDMPLYALGLGMLFVGLILGGLIVSTAHIGHSLRQRKYKHQADQKIKAVENELHSVRMEYDLHKKSSAPTATLLPPAAK